MDHSKSCRVGAVVVEGSLDELPSAADGARLAFLSSLGLVALSRWHVFIFQVVEHSFRPYSLLCGTHVWISHFARLRNCGRLLWKHCVDLESDWPLGANWLYFELSISNKSHCVVLMCSTDFLQIQGYHLLPCYFNTYTANVWVQGIPHQKL